MLVDTFLAENFVMLLNISIFTYSVGLLVGWTLKLALIVLKNEKKRKIRRMDMGGSIRQAIFADEFWSE